MIGGTLCFGFGVWLLVLGDGAGVGGDAGEGLWGWLGRRSGSHKLWGWVVWHTHLEICLPIDTRIPAPLFGGQWGVAGAGRGGVHENGQVAGVGWVVVGSNLGMRGGVLSIIIVFCNQTGRSAPAQAVLGTAGRQRRPAVFSTISQVCYSMR